MCSDIPIEKILYDMLSIPSVNGTAGELMLAEYIQSLFDAYGVENQLIVTSKNRANVIASIEGQSQKSHIVLNGHLDTVPFGNLYDWETPPETPVVKDGIVYCRGASDMKSGLAAMVSALCKLSKDGVKPKHTIRFFATSDEERTGEGATWVRFQGYMKNSCLLIVGEPTDNAIALAAKGCVWLVMKIKGRASHSAYPEQGVSAFEHGLWVIDRLKEFMVSQIDPLLGIPSLVITKASSGIADNMVPDEATFHLDIRTIPSMQYDVISDEIDRIITWLYKIEPRITVSFEAVNVRNALNTSMDDKYVKEFVSCVPEHPQYIGVNFYSESSIPNKDNEIPCILFGPGSMDSMHKANECCSLEQYRKAFLTFFSFLKAC